MITVYLLPNEGTTATAKGNSLPEEANYEKLPVLNSHDLKCEKQE